MKLTRVVIEGYRSIRERLALVVERNVTVVLGPNDHGKTNLLGALTHLNAASAFAPDDLNWDTAEKADSLPFVSGTFHLSDDERRLLLANENQARDNLNRKLEESTSEDDSTEGEKAEEVPTPPTPSVAPPLPAPRTLARTPIDEEPEDESDEEEEGENDDPLPAESLPLIQASDIPAFIEIRRVGLRGAIEIFGLEDCQKSVRKDFAATLPRVELIEPITKLSDSVSAEEMIAGKNEFMRGIFYYAELDPNHCADLFEQNDRTQMTITRASKKLNETLRVSWSQGKDLQFRLTHHSKEKRIELQIEDPSVKSTYVRASRRSSGFTHYFSLKTILYARQNDHPADSYILLFDEPGVFLHPSGQFDLLQVLETLAMESQTIYVTHSLFMISKTFPTRHRLLMKGAEGTTLDGKPYVGRWQAVLGALGMSLTGSILFANYVVLTEGDSDPIYIYAMIQKAVLAGKSRLDINPLAVMSTSESRHADVLLRLLLETKPRPKIAVITDGDKGGKERLRFIQNMMKENAIPEKGLLKDTTIEDHIPLIREVYVPAVAIYVGKLLVMEGKTKPDEGELVQKFLAHFDRVFEKGKVTQGVAGWAEKASQEIGGIEGKPSKVGIAREYAALLFQRDCPEFKLESRTKSLLDWIQQCVGVPELNTLEKKILEE